MKKYNVRIPELHYEEALKYFKNEKQFIDYLEIRIDTLLRQNYHRDKELRQDTVLLEIAVNEGLVKVLDAYCNKYNMTFDRIVNRYVNKLIK